MDPEAVAAPCLERAPGRVRAFAAALALFGLLTGLLTSGAVDAAGAVDVAVAVDATMAVDAQPADPRNVFVVIEPGDDHVSLVDGDRFEIYHRFPSRRVQFPPVFTPDGRYVYLASRDGWITKYDIPNLAVVTEVRAGHEMSGLALSGDGLWLMVANASPRTLALFDSDLRLARTYPLTTLDGRRESRAAAVYDATPRQSFIVALNDIAELWEVSYDIRAEPIFDGLVHDYRMKEGIAKPGYLGVRRLPLEAPMEALLFEPGYRYAIGAGDATQARVVNFDVRREITRIPTPGLALLQAGIGFSWNDAVLLAYPSGDRSEVTVVDAKTWRVVKTIATPVATPGSGAWLSSHKHSPYVWVSSPTDERTDSPNKDLITVIDKQTLAAAGKLRGPGRTLSHVEFTRDGRYALLSVDGAIIVFDTTTLQEIKRLPMPKPGGIYNVGNRIGHAAPGAVR